MTIDDALGAQDYCYVTTAGRVTGNPHTVEIWFALRDSTIYILAGGRDRSDWVRNSRKQPRVTVRIDDRWFDGTASIIEPSAPEDALARRMLLEKYSGSNSDLEEWGRTALPVAIDLTPGISSAS